MKTPTLKIGKCSVKYIQVPYFGRYFVFATQYAKNQSVKIESYKNELIYIMVNGMIQ